MNAATGDAATKMAEQHTPAPAAYESPEARREAFRRYLEQTGVLAALTRALVAVYEQDASGRDKLNAVDFVRRCDTGGRGAGAQPRGRSHKLGGDPHTRMPLQAPPHPAPAPAPSSPSRSHITASGSDTRDAQQLAAENDALREEVVQLTEQLAAATDALAAARRREVAPVPPSHND